MMSLIFGVVFCVSVVVLVINVGKKASAEAKAVAIDELIYLLEEGSKIGVQAAEQLKASGRIDNKQRYVNDFVTRLLAKYKMNVDFIIVNSFIESAVAEFNARGDD